MGRIGDSTKRVPSTGGVFVKFQDGDKLRFRILGEPYVRVTQYGNDEPQYAYLFPVWDYASAKARIISQGVGGAREIDDMNDEWGEEYPSKYDLTIKATGSGKNGRKYTRTSSPHQGTMPPTREIEMIKWADSAPGAIPLEDFNAGKDPELQVREDTSAEATPPAEEREEAKDNLPTDEQVEALSKGGINLDDIPF